MIFGVRSLAVSATVLVLAACDPGVPDDRGAGVGFGDVSAFEAEQRARDAALASGTSLGLPAGAEAPVTDIAGVGEAETVGQPRAGTELLARGPGISDENDFEAVSDRLTIEDDAARLAAQREQYRVVEPTALPSRPGGDSFDAIVRFALATSHRVGQSVYPRSGGSAERAARACGRYSGPNAAQQAFLNAGGPERDRNGLDPDGDGYVCGWDPRPFRLAVRN
ncbi:hypothetical protein [Tropicimonas sp. S265A]|uniref:hypothetical protein n=1 Tax=Tropicimonas sp. S265A TaxID=3415134 RepID=UPI003C7EAD8B